MRNNVKKLRLEKGWTRERLADLTALTVQTIRRLEEKQTRKPQWRTITRLLDAFGKTSIKDVFPDYYKRTLTPAADPLDVQKKHTEEGP